MKKYIVLVGIFLVSVSLYAGEPVFANDYVFQKQLLVGNKNTCQTVRIAKNWFLTAAHCVTPCLGKKCKLQILLAAGEVNALSEIPERDVFIPPQYQDVDEKGRPITHTYWDVALLRYHPKEVFFKNANGEEVSAETFKEALAENEDLNIQWKGAQKPKYPTLYSFSRAEDMPVKVNVFVPLWSLGEMSVLSEPEQVLYLGEHQSLWASAGFGVDHGNSGGGVYLQKGGLLGVATAKRVNDLPKSVKKEYPAFAQADEFFLFNGFSKQTTLAFIQKTLQNFGDQVKIKELEVE